MVLDARRGGQHVAGRVDHDHVEVLARTLGAVRRGRVGRGRADDGRRPHQTARDRAARDQLATGQAAGLRRFVLGRHVCGVPPSSRVWSDR